MKTQTILSAFLTRRDELDDRYIIHGPRRARLEIQVSKFYNELLRRMDERDEAVARRANAPTVVNIIARTDARGAK